jgi:hypothetical protein
MPKLKWWQKVCNWMEARDAKIIADWHARHPDIACDPYGALPPGVEEPKTWIKIIPDRETNDPYLVRHYFINLRPLARIVIHKFERSDTDGGLHDHPWIWASYILAGGYWEHTTKGKFWRAPGQFAMHSAKHLHRVELDSEKAGGETWTLFFMGPKWRDWGFVDDVTKQWMRWDLYLRKRKQDYLNRIKA